MPARRYIVSPAAGGPLTMTGASLPSATQGIAYSQNVANAARAGNPAYSFSLAASTGPDGWGVSVAGAITGTPSAGQFWVDDQGNYVVDTNSNVVVNR